MKSNFRRAAIAMLTLTFVLLGTVIPTYASVLPKTEVVYDEGFFSQTPEVSGFSDGLSEGRVSIPSGATVPEGLQPNDAENMAKMAYADAILNQRARIQTASAPYWVTLSGTMYCYPQINNYYCAPATAQGVVRYMTGANPASQDVIAKAMGTTSSSGTGIDSLSNYLDNTISGHRWTWSATSSSLTILRSININVDLYNAPVVPRIVVSNSSSWHYITNGHFLYTYAIMSDDSQVLFADSLMGYLGLGNGFYSRTGTNVTNVTTHFVW